MKSCFYSFSEKLFLSLEKEEVLLVSFKGESSSFVRFNKGQVRQAGNVIQQNIELKLSVGQRVVSANFNLSSERAQDLLQGQNILKELRTTV